MAAFRGLADDLPLMEWLYGEIFPREKRWGTAELVAAAFPGAMAEMIRSGTTCSADMYYHTTVSATLAARAGFRYAPGEGVIDFPSPSFETVEEGLVVSRQLVEKFADHPTVHPTVAAHAPYTCAPETLISVDALSQEYGVPFQLHIAETPDETQIIQDRYSTTPVRHLHNLGLLSPRLLGAHSVHLDEEETALYADAGVKVSHDPESNAKLGSGLAPVPQFLEAGITVGLSTDGPCSNNDLDLFGEMRTAALVHKLHGMDPTVLPAPQTLRMATWGSATALGIGDKVGSLEKGKEADIVALDLSKPHLTPLYDPVSHLVYSAGRGDVSDVWVAGKRLLQDNELVTMDEEASLLSLRQWGERLRDG